jgi:UDP-2,3-diacylglucosamine pyrophosphatase LpxH
MDALVMSDLHLGSKASRARDAIRLLGSRPFCRLILLGDVFCDLNLHRLGRADWQFLACLRKLSAGKAGVEVVWVEGNHDRALMPLMSRLLGLKAQQEYMWEFRGSRHLALHGHQFDDVPATTFLPSGLIVGAVAHASRRGAHRVLCGHTHQALEVELNGIGYFNSGAWCGSHPTYIAIDDDGVQIRTVLGEPQAQGDSRSSRRLRPITHWPIGSAEAAG